METGSSFYTDEQTGVVLGIEKGKYVAIVDGEKVPAEIADVDTGFFDLNRWVYVMAAAIQ